MDERLIAWARAVAQHAKPRAVARDARAPLPVLWLFTDAARLPDPLPAIARLPRGLAGVVFRHDAAPDRARLGARVAALCRQRRLALVVAGDARLAARLHAGLHLREGRVPGRIRNPWLTPASAHGMPGLRRARRAGAKIVFLSPVFPTGSHPGQPALGPVRAARLARQAGGANVYWLGGITAATLPRVPRFVPGIGAIGAFAALGGSARRG
jgi:thiamine-phosphate pyrophosphorylase